MSETDKAVSKYVIVIPENQIMFKAEEGEYLDAEYQNGLLFLCSRDANTRVMVKLHGIFKEWFVCLIQELKDIPKMEVSFKAEGDSVKEEAFNTFIREIFEEEKIIVKTICRNELKQPMYVETLQDVVIFHLNNFAGNIVLKAKEKGMLEDLD